MPSRTSGRRRSASLSSGQETRRYGRAGRERAAAVFSKLGMLTRRAEGVGGGLTVLAAILARIGGRGSGSVLCVKHWTRPQAPVAVSQRLLLQMRKLVQVMPGGDLQNVR